MIEWMANNKVIELKSLTRINEEVYYYDYKT